MVGRGTAPLARQSPPQRPTWIQALADTKGLGSSDHRAFATVRRFRFTSLIV